MKTSSATFSISGNLVEKLEAIAAVGFDSIEIFEKDFIAHDGNPREVGELIRSMGAVRLIIASIRVVGQSKSMRSITNATQREQRHGSA